MVHPNNHQALAVAKLNKRFMKRVRVLAAGELLV